MITGSLKWHYIWGASNHTTNDVELEQPSREARGKGCSELKHAFQAACIVYTRFFSSSLLLISWC